MGSESNRNHESILDNALKEFVDAQLAGGAVDVDEFVSGYPECEDQLRQRIRDLNKIETLFDSLVRTDESDFGEGLAGRDLTGQKIGSFEIGEVIGRGGMGVVYLARDTKLDRSVAVKSMPAKLVGDSTARLRFKREAKLLASLNHPNIGVIHDIIEPDTGSSLLVLEYIAGLTLTERIGGKALQVADALSLSLQIGEALSAAYMQGITHRDLKPGNIKITPEGRVKVLDFGMAKSSPIQDENPDVNLTQAGRVVGTPAYMSPEQARGGTTDHRSDIWSFGCVLYEMLTGRRPFEGETISDTIVCVLQGDPDWGLLPASTPANIRVLIRRCLEKKPSERLQHIGDAIIEISETMNVPAVEPPYFAPTASAPRGKRQRVFNASLLCLLLVSVVVSLVLWNRDPVSQSINRAGDVPTRRTFIRLPDNHVLGFYQSTTFANRQPAFALSPDGSRLVYVARTGETSQLFERQMDGFEDRAIPGTEGAFAPFLSPDGQSVGFFAGGDLKVVSLLGGEPVTICSPKVQLGGCWGGDDMIYFIESWEGSQYKGMLSRVPAVGGQQPERLEAKFKGSVERGEELRYPQVLPGGRAVLVSSGADAKVFSLENWESKVVVKAAQHARYVPTGHLVYARAGAIEAVPFDLDRLEVTGSRVTVLDGVLLDSGTGVTQLTFSDDGTLIYAPGSDTHKTRPVWIDRQRNVEPLAMPADIYGALKLSPDGKRLAIIVKELQSNIYVFDITTGTRIQLALEDDNFYPLWTPDGKGVVFSCHREGQENWSLFRAPADGIGEAELLYSGTSKMVPYSWSSDGKLLALTENSNISLLSLEGERKLEPVVQTQFIKFFPAFSPDGRWIANSSDKDGDFQIYVRPYPAMDRVIPISREFGEEPIWSANGDELFYRNRDKWMVVSISTKPEFKAGTPQVVFEGPYINVSGLSYDVAPDGQRFLVLQPQYDDSQVTELIVVTNWFEELKQLAPSLEDR